MRLSSVCLLMLSTTLMGCELLNEKVVTVQTPASLQADEHFNHKLSDLIEQLTQGKQFDYQKKPVAFTTLVWMDTLTLKSDQRSATLLGHQISSSLKTELVQRGGKVVEHKSAQAISMSDNASYYLTRKLNELSQNIEVSYVLAGTLLEIKGGVAVNVEVIDIDSHIIVSSARTFISNENLPELNNVFLKEGKIYRKRL
ncbi:MAG: TolB-like protein [Cognaticolwellia sp.]|jgi:TolB-like protein